MPFSELTVSEAIVRDEPLEQLQWGNFLAVDFSETGNSRAFLGSGWSHPESDFTWAIGFESRLTLPVPPALADSLVMEVDVEPYMPVPATGGQVLRVFVGDKCVGGCTVTGRLRLLCHLGADMLGGKSIEVVFRHPSFIRGDMLGASDDSRPLAFRFRSVLLYSPLLPQFFASKGAEIGLPGFDLRPADVILGGAVALGEQGRTYSFRTDEEGAQYLREGWFADAAGDLWSSETTSRIELPAPQGPESYRLRVALAPLLVRDLLPRQPITILVQDTIVGQYYLSSDTLLSLPLPRELIAGVDTIRLSFVTRAGVSMSEFKDGSDTRRLSFVLESIRVEPLPDHIADVADLRGDDTGVLPVMATAAYFLDSSLDELPGLVQAALGVELPKILRDFESLGDNCAFGLAQRKGGAEVLGMLRFANTPLKNLLQGLDDAFKAATDPSEMTLRPHTEGSPPEYMLWIDRYGIRWHTLVHQNQADAESVFEEQSTKAVYLRRKFMESLRAGRKIYALARMDPKKIETVMPSWGANSRYELRPEDLRASEVLSVFLSLNGHAKNTLLYFVSAKRHGKPSGLVEMIVPGLLIGYIDCDVILPDVEILDHLEWMRVIVNAWIMEHGANAMFRGSEHVTPWKELEPPVSVEAEPMERRRALGPRSGALSLPQLMVRFESLGENCEFGLVQRRGGAEPLGLFRFASAPYEKLLKALLGDFDGLGQPDLLEIQVAGNEYMVLDKKYGLLTHTWELVAEKTAEEVRLREIRRLPFLVRKLVEDLGLGEKIFVYHGMQPLTLEQAKTLAAALRRYGPTTLLWVELADAAHPPGSVEEIDPSLLKGYVDRFAPGENAHDFSFDVWVDLCRAALRVYESA
jgi:hypothetical protein